MLVAPNPAVTDAVRCFFRQCGGTVEIDHGCTFTTASCAPRPKSRIHPLSFLVNHPEGAHQNKIGLGFVGFAERAELLDFATSRARQQLSGAPQHSWLPSSGVRFIVFGYSSVSRGATDRSGVETTQTDC